MSEQRWSVFIPAEKRYVSGRRGTLAWTRSREEADRTALAVGGEVVDADDFARNYGKYLERESGDEG